MRSCTVRMFGAVRGCALFSATRILLNDQLESIPQLRARLRQQRTAGAMRMVTIDTESRLVLTLARSSQQSEREEALESAERLWRELMDRSEPIPAPSRTAMRVTLCSAMRRCAFQARDRELAELWTQRFTERTQRLSPEDFMHTPEEQAAWRDPRASGRRQAATGMGDDRLDGDDDDEQQQSSAAAGAGGAPGKKSLSPLEQYRHDVIMDHPTLQYAFRSKRKVEPGPRYTG